MSDMSIVHARPLPMSLANIDTGLELEAQFNPEQLKEKLKVNWAELSVLGLSHKILQYINTDNHLFTFDLHWHALYRGKNHYPELEKAKRFMQHLCYARRGSNTVQGGAPARVLFVWPNMVSMTCVIDELGFEHTRFNLQAGSVVMSIAVTVKEIRDKRLFAEDVLAYGTQRAGGG